MGNRGAQRSSASQEEVGLRGARQGEDHRFLGHHHQLWLRR